MKVILAILAVVLYANTLGGRFAYDDAIVVEHNSFVHQGFAGIPHILSTFYWAGYWDYNSGLYRPLSLIGFAVQWALFKDSAGWYHAVNVALYAVTLLLLFSTLRKLLSEYSAMMSFAATALFAAHPTHTEVVANIKSQDELLCFIFALLTVRLVLRDLDRPSRANVFLGCVCFFLALLAKEGALVFLGAIPLMLYFFKGMEPKAIVQRTAPLAMVGAFWLALHFWATHSNAPPIQPYHLDDNALVGAKTFLEREATAAHIMGRYLLLLVFPLRLSYDYSYNQIPLTSFASAKALVPLLICAALAFIALWELRRKTIVSFGILFFLITISMTSNLIVLIGATMADRFLYVPSLGFCVVLAYYWTRLMKVPADTSVPLRIPIRKLVPVCVVLSLYSYRTVTRNADWHDNASLFLSGVQSAPASARTHYNVGHELLDSVPGESTPARKNTLGTAISELETAVSIDSTAFLFRLNLASAYMYDGDFEKAEREASGAIAISDADPKAYFVRGSADYSMGKYAEAIKFLTIATQKGLNDDAVWNYLGGAYAGMHTLTKATECFEKALAVNPQSLNAYKNLGSAYANMNQLVRARGVFEKGLEVNPSDPQLNELLGATLESLGDSTEARYYLNLADQLKDQFHD